MINNLLCIYDYLNLNKNFYSILNEFKNINLINIKINNIYDILDSKFNKYCIVELEQEIYNEKIYILVNKNSIVDDLNLFINNPIKYHRLA